MLFCFATAISCKLVDLLVDSDSHQSPIGIKAFERVIEHTRLMPLVRLIRTPENHRYHTVSSRYRVTEFVVVSQPLSGSRHRRSQKNKTMIAGYLCGNAAANQRPWLLANPSIGFTASPKFTIETAAGADRAPDHA